MSNSFDTNLLTDQEIEDLIVTAIEGGSNYWYYLDRDSVDQIKNSTPDMNGEPLSLRLVEALKNGAQVNVNDYEDTTEVLGTITKESTVNAARMLARNYVYHYCDAITGNGDVICADIFFQLAVMGEVKFG